MKKILKYLPYLILIFIIVAFFKSCKDYEEKIALDKQNYLGKNTELQKLNDSIYHRYILVDRLNKSLISSNEAKDDEILAQSKIVLQLRKIIAQITGVVIKDTIFVEVPNNCIGLRLGFTNSNSFYSYTDTVIVQNPPLQKFELTFNPIDIAIELSRNEEGIWESLLKLNTDVSKYIDLGKYDVTVSKDLYLQSQPTLISFVPNFSLQTDLQKTYFTLGLFAIVKDKHLFGYSKSINGNLHSITYGYKINF